MCYPCHKSQDSQEYIEVEYCNAEVDSCLWASLQTSLLVLHDKSVSVSQLLWYSLQFLDLIRFIVYHYLLMCIF